MGIVTFSLLKRKSNQKEKNILSADNNETTRKNKASGSASKRNYK